MLLNKAEKNTLQNAMESFKKSLEVNGLGNTEQAERMKNTYLVNIKKIEEKLQEEVVTHDFILSDLEDNEKDTLKIVLQSFSNALKNDLATKTFNHDEEKVPEIKSYLENVDHIEEKIKSTDRSSLSDPEQSTLYVALENFKLAIEHNATNDENVKNQAITYLTNITKIKDKINYKAETEDYILLQLEESEKLTLKVVLQNFGNSLKNFAAGQNEDGKKMVSEYLSNIDKISDKMSYIDKKIPTVNVAQLRDKFNPVNVSDNIFKKN